ncbi:MAG TPA: CPBP family intramembrane glutamic endopeptidase [Ktedonobacterales bacterium]|nr:CPBP family intramembrane glutamic endopeptidase [Ktedonobacterales bacterium]
MSAISQDAATATKPQQSFAQRQRWSLIVLGVTIISAVVQLVAGGTTIIGVLFEPLLIALMLILPRKFPAINVLAGKTRARLIAEVRPLLGYALLFPVLLIPIVIWGSVQNLPLFPDRTTSWVLSWNYIVVGKILLLFVPAIYFGWRIGGNGQQFGLSGITGAWRWIGPSIITLLYAALLALDFLGGNVPAIPFLPAVTTIILIILAAGFTEEFFYRVLLQTRLENLVGRWNGIAITTFLFALLHLPSRYAFVWRGHTGNPVFDLGLALTAVIVSKGITGYALGFLWSRYRNLWINVNLHTLIDGLPLVLLVAGAAVKIS